MKKITIIQIILFLLALNVIPLIHGQNQLGVGITINGPPDIKIYFPRNDSGTNTNNITIAYNVSDNGLVSNCSLFINGLLNITSTLIVNNAQLYFDVSNLDLGVHFWSINCTDSTGIKGNSDLRRFYVNKVGSFNGTTTNLSDYDISNIGTLVLEVLPYGKMIFNNINLSLGYDFDSYVNIQRNNAGLVPENINVLNKTSSIYLYGLGFSNPIIMRDGQACPGTICSINSYSGGTLIFTVTGFSTYSAAETPQEAASSPTSTSGGGGSGGGGGGGGIKEQIQKKPNFDIDKNTLKISIKQGQTKRERISIKNTGEIITDISADLSKLGKFKVYPESSLIKFTLNPNEDYEMELNFKATEKDTPDLYPSKITFTSGNTVKELPVLIEVESADPLFDADVEILPQSKKTIAGNEVLLEVNLFNVRSIGRVDVVVDYAIKDMEGNTVASEQETLAVESKATFTRSLLIPSDLKPGTYIAFVKINYGNQVALSSDLFEVSAKEIRLSPVKLSDPKIIFTLIAASLIFTWILFSYWQFSNKKMPEVSEKTIIGKEKSDKLEKEMASLESAYNSGFISKESYEKEKGRISEKIGKK